MFPSIRMRRLRQTARLRALFQENDWHFKDLITPLFVKDGGGQKEAISAMPGVYRFNLEELLQELDHPFYREVGGILLFGLPAIKDDQARNAWEDDGIVQRACRRIKESYPDLVVITDLCMCSYTTHGHCGILDAAGRVDNDRTLEVLGRIAVAQARAGADIIAPSDMMDGRVAAIRQCLDQSGLADVLILSYAAKFASAFYGPFREAADSAPKSGDRKSYQMNPANRREALREMAEDVAEGTDMLMIKPGLAYLDILRDARERFDLPLAVYNVSGEYAMVKAAAAQQWIDEAQLVTEMMTGFKRAGADLIITYHGRDLYQWQEEVMA